MINSKRIAGLIGPTILVVTLSEMMNLHIWATNIPPNTYLNGTLLFVAGLSIVRAHNVWQGWPVMVTLTGWFVMLGGMYRMFFPEAQQLPQSVGSYITIACLFVVGAFLTFKAFSKVE